MEHSTNILIAAATDEPAVPPTPSGSGRPAAPADQRLPESLIAPALDAGRDVRLGRATRRDGWTPERIRIFLDILAEGGTVAAAARAAGISRTSAYNLRNRPAGRAFRDVWDAADHPRRPHRVSASAREPLSALPPARSRSGGAADHRMATVNLVHFTVARLQHAFGRAAPNPPNPSSSSISVGRSRPPACHARRAR